VTATPLRRLNALEGYPEAKTPRVVGPVLRTIRQPFLATYRGKEFYDGDRNCGYGGYSYDGRWWLGLYGNGSDMTGSRATEKKVEIDLKRD